MTNVVPLVWRLLYTGSRERQGHQSMLRISETGFEQEKPMLSLEGHIMGPWVEELRQYCDRLLLESDGLVLDLAEVAYVNRDGLELLRTLCRRRVTLSNCTPFVAEQLKQAASC